MLRQNERGNETAMLVEDILQQATIFGDNACWIWNGPVSEKGYGRIQIDGRKVLVHRFVYEKLKRPLMSIEGLHHKCKIKRCINPNHVEPFISDHPDGGPAFQRAKTHCPNGHEYTELNTYRPPSGGRICRICRRKKDEIRNAKGRNHGKKRT